jgi:hypothetical protein
VAGANDSFNKTFRDPRGSKDVRTNEYHRHPSSGPGPTRRRVTIAELLAFAFARLMPLIPFAVVLDVEKKDVQGLRRREIEI